MTVEESREFYETVARFYDAENAFKTEDLEFYSDLAAETGEPILDVGSGTGRVVLHIAQEGYRLFGMEPSSEMLARAERKLEMMPDLRGRVTMVQGDILTAGYDERFALIMVSYHAFMHLRTQEEQVSALQRFRKWLAPGGLLVIDLPNAGELYATSDDGSVILERSFQEPESGHMVMQQSVSELDRTEQLMYITWIYDELGDDGAVYRTIAPLTLHYYFPAEVSLLLRVAGLELVEFWGDYDRAPFEDGCSRMITVARASERV